MKKYLSMGQSDSSFQLFQMHELHNVALWQQGSEGGPVTDNLEEVRRRFNITSCNTYRCTGIGLSTSKNGGLVLQGEVEQISMMKPVAQGPHDTGLLEYLEDIIGTDQYMPQLEEGAKRYPPCALQKHFCLSACMQWGAPSIVSPLSPSLSLQYLLNAGQSLL